MTRRSNARGSKPPSYRLHKRSGQAVVYINGKDQYLGQHGSVESKQKYQLLLSDVWSNSDQPDKPTIPTTKETITIGFLAIEHGKYCLNKYQKNGKPSNEWLIVKNVLKAIRATYGDLPASEFGPIRFDNYRQSMVDRGLARSTINRNANHLLKMFQRAVKMEIIPSELYHRLKAVGSVEMEFKPPKKVVPVDMSLVRATQNELTQTVSDMVEIQLLTGMRPGEVCTLRPCDINRDADIWIYSPPSHKTQHHGKERPVVIGPKAQLVLNRYLLRDQQAFCFTPSEAFEQHCQRRSDQRKTPTGYGNGPRPRKERAFKPRYNSDSYRVAIQRAALRAFPIPEGSTELETEAWEAIHKWSPNQLRHSAATNARKEYDLETAQILLGHSNKRTTEQFYAEHDLSRAVTYATNFG